MAGFSFFLHPLLLLLGAEPAGGSRVPAVCGGVLASSSGGPARSGGDPAGGGEGPAGCGGGPASSCGGPANSGGSQASSSGGLACSGGGPVIVNGTANSVVSPAA